MRVPLGPGGGSISAVVKVVRVMITMECSEEETLCCYMFSLSMKGAKHAIGLMMIDGDPARLDRPDLYAELLPPSVIRSPSLHNVEDDEALPGLGLSNPRRWNPLTTTCSHRRCIPDGPSRHPQSAVNARQYPHSPREPKSMST